MEDNISQPLLPRDSPKKKRGENSKWTKEEVKYVENLVKTKGTKNWSIVAKLLNEKFPDSLHTATQCHVLWRKHSRSGLGKNQWTEKEEVELLLAHRIHKNSWANISTELHGRPSNSIKNRFYTIFRKVRNKVKKEDYSFESEYEVLQILYMVSVMESYMTMIKKAEGNSEMEGKDFIYKLTLQLDGKMLEQYSAKFKEFAKKYGTVQQLFQKILNADITATATQIGAHKESLVTKPNPESQIDCNPLSIEAIKEIDEVQAKEAAKEKELFAALHSYKRPLIASTTPCSSAIGTSVLKFSPSILSAGPAAAAAVAYKAPCFQADPENMGFSEFTERGFSVQDKCSIEGEMNIVNLNSVGQLLFPTELNNPKENGRTLMNNYL
eukprot:TRINITY_DN4313_c0_g1_i9.p1 TRINITY_DN4313_c0_g1~~TRINITY_DN4313_c0_g1_i9.p1  ORF type:complete len:382 (-),score=58.65 TRINITY_DN4313_c0_g1_i9:96-1241(-)